MTALLEAIRAEVLLILTPYDGTHFFVKRAKAPDALLSSDLPRRTADAQDARLRLTQAGFEATVSEGLLSIGLGEPALERFLPAAPPEAISFPDQPSLEGAYALYRLLAAHQDAGLCDRTLVYDYLKAEEQGLDAIVRLIPSLQGRCAACLRKREPLPDRLILRLSLILKQRSDTI